jgi:type IV pilus assembly protein PilA
VRFRDEAGFTLMEILVVFLIMAVLAALALPTILGERDKGHDASAKSNARNLLTQVESCFVKTEDYRNCNNSDLDPTGLPLPGSDGATPAPDQVSVEVTPAAKEYTIAARSVDGTLFRITKGPTGITHSCTPDVGGCKNSTW